MRLPSRVGTQCTVVARLSISQCCSRDPERAQPERRNPLQRNNMQVHINQSCSFRRGLASGQTMVPAPWSSSSNSRHITTAALRKIGNNPQRSLAFEVNLQRLLDSEYTPNRHIGPVEVAMQPGRGRGVLAKEDLYPASLLFVSEPVGSILYGQPGQQLQPEHLLQHWQTAKPGLSAADRVKLSLLSRPDCTSSSLLHVSFKDFSSSKATNKAKKATAKGFGAAATKQQQSSTAAVELSEQQLAATLACNAYGDDHTDGALTYGRREQQQSLIGVFPEFALLNHSCVPNTSAPVLLKDRLLLRSAVVVPAGQELTTSYLGLAGGMPRQQRQQLLKQHYGFLCGCHRCKAEEQAPADVTNTLQAMHEWSSTIDTPQLLHLMAQGDSSLEQLTELHQKATQFVQQLEQQLQQVTEPVVVAWLRASAYATYALMLRTGEFLAGAKDANAAKQLAELVRVFAPASEPHILLLLDSVVRAHEAAADTAAAQTAPDETQEVRVQQLVRALALRYGEAKDQSWDLLSQLAASVSASLSPHWLGLIDLDGSMGLQKLVEQLEAAKAAKVTESSDGKQKVELDMSKLGLLQISKPI